MKKGRSSRKAKSSSSSAQSQKRSRNREQSAPPTRKRTHPGPATLTVKWMTHLSINLLQQMTFLPLLLLLLSIISVIKALPGNTSNSTPSARTLQVHPLVILVSGLCCSLCIVYSHVTICPCTKENACIEYCNCIHHLATSSNSMFTVAPSHLHSPATMFSTILHSHFRVALHWLPGGRHLGHIKEFGQPHLTTAIYWIRVFQNRLHLYNTFCSCAVHQCITPSPSQAHEKDTWQAMFDLLPQN